MTLLLRGRNIAKEEINKDVLSFIKAPDLAEAEKKQLTEFTGEFVNNRQAGL